MGRVCDAFQDRLFPEKNDAELAFSTKRRGVRKCATTAPRLPAPKGWFALCQRCRMRRIEFRIDAPSPYVVAARMSAHVETEHALECYFCFLKFAGFAELAEHVNEAHTEPEKRHHAVTGTKGQEQEWWKQSGGEATSSRGRRLRSIPKGGRYRKTRKPGHHRSDERPGGSRFRIFRHADASAL